jgi:uncharacterized protein involved in type VI secretion and phage assembly
MEMEKVIANLVQKVERRFYGKYRAYVVDNADPEQLGRLKVSVPSVLGQDIAVWAFPCLPYGGSAGHGWWFIPEIDAGVWVEFEEGDPEFPIWVGTFWSKPGGESEVPKPNSADGSEEGSVQDPPTRKIIKSTKGHTIQFEDADGDEMVTIVEAANNHVITMDKDGIKITDGTNGHEVVLDKDGIKTTDGANGHEVVLANSGITVTDGVNNNEIAMEGSGVTIKSGANINIGDGAAEPLVLGNALNMVLSQFLIMLNTHMHTGNMGAPTPIVAPLQLDISSALSPLNMVK